MWRVKLIRYVWDTLCKQVTPWAADARHGRLTPVRRYDFTSVGKADPGVPAPSIRTPSQPMHIATQIRPGTLHKGSAFASGAELPIAGPQRWPHSRHQAFHYRAVPDSRRSLLSPDRAETPAS